MSKEKTRGGAETSLQVGIFGNITNLDTKDFELGNPFQVKNDNEEDIFLEINGWNMHPDSFIKTRFPGGGT